MSHPRGGDLSRPDDLPPRVRDELVQFFLSAIFFEPKNPKMLGWGGPEEADKLVGSSRRRGTGDRGKKAARR